MEKFSAVFRGRPDRESALSEIIGFVMILGVIMMFLLIWSLYVVPAQGREAEIAHMDGIKNWYTGYKTTLDALWINNQNGINAGMLASSSMTLGSLGGNTEAAPVFLPLMQPIGSYGTLGLHNYSETLELTLPETQQIRYDLNVLEYTSGNYYWIPQSYYYQMGGVFVNQSSGTLARIAPLISIYRISPKVLGVRITPVSLSPASGVTEITGSAYARVDTRLRESLPVTINRGPENPYSFVLLVFHFRDPSAAEAWWSVIREILNEQNVNESQYDLSLVGSSLYLNVSPERDDNVSLMVYPANFTVAVQPIGSVIS